VNDHKQLQEKTNKQQDKLQHADRVKITYYTDPLCCWSWAFEPQWRRLCYEFGDCIAYEYRMGGLISNWNNYNDVVNSISRPLQMGPLWMQAHHVSGMPMQDRIWMNDPPQSSYPACVAVKCAALQSAIAEEKYLRYAREAAMIHGRNIARQNVLFEIAEQLADEINFDVHQFKEDYTTGAGIENFKNDMQQVQYKNINRFPTLTVTNGESGIIVTGYRSYHSLLDVMKNFIPVDNIEAINIEDYKKYYNSLTEREVEEAEKSFQLTDL
jgi:predicted DsbA family dithiol-disulfide isomerase